MQRVNLRSNKRAWPSSFARTVSLKHVLRQASPHACGVAALALSVIVASIDTQATNYPAQFELSTLAAGDGSTGFVLIGNDGGDSAGTSVSAGGDVNGDGIDDLLIGAPGVNPSKTGGRGEVYVIFGRNSGFAPTISLSTTGDGGNGFVVSGVSAHDKIGDSVSNAGDVNGDGIDDIIIGAALANNSSNIRVGKAFVVLGRSNGFPSRVRLSDIENGDGTTGFVIVGADEFDRTGGTVSAAGDVNHDGIDDLLIGAADATGPNGQSGSGESYVIYGRSTGFSAQLELSSLASSDGSAGFVLQGEGSFDNLGLYLCDAGDINNDGISDIAINAPAADTGSIFGAGQTYVVFGRSSGFPSQFPVASLVAGDGSEGFVINGAEPFAGIPGSLGCAGDINGDGIDDLIIGSVEGTILPSGEERGKSYVVFGRSMGFPPEIELSSFEVGNGSQGFVLNGINEGDQSGWSVDGTGDINKDGIGDIIIGAITASPAGRLEAGESYVVLGRSAGFTPEFDLSTLATGDGSTGFVLNGIDNFERSGFDVSSAGDINNDGIDDFVIGARQASEVGAVAAGEAYVVFGRLLDSDEDGTGDAVDNCTLVSNFDQRDTDADGFGNRCDPDLNNDGIVNFVDVSQWTELFNTINNDDEDFNGDGAVNFGDFVIVLEYIFGEPGPSALVE